MEASGYDREFPRKLPAPVNARENSFGTVPAQEEPPVKIMATILIAEDDEGINSMVSLTLRMQGYEVLQARDGAQTLEIASSQIPDLILLDVMMPQLSGYDVARALHEHQDTESIPIIFVTAKQELEDRLQGLTMAVDYVCKPFVMPELLARIAAALRTRQLHDELKTSNEKLARLAITDELTGLCNRRGFLKQLEEELWRARRFKYSLAILMFDLDHFKAINDSWGHAQGDLVLQEFARVLSHTSRRIDTVGRYGGEEFTALLPATNAEGAFTVAEKIRIATQDLEIPLVTNSSAAPGHLNLTVSGGAAILTEINDNEDETTHLAHLLVQIADRCLYQAKDAGRNRIVVETIDSI